MDKHKNRKSDLNENLDQQSSPEWNEEKRQGRQDEKQKGSSSTATRENVSSEGYGSSQRKDDKNVGPMDAELDDLPSESRTSRNNQTGPGLG